MSSVDSSSYDGLATPNIAEPEPNPNADLIAGLREVAAWLEEHDELPAGRWASVYLRDVGYGLQPDATARPMLEMLAAALGDRATERVSGEDVRIEGKFSGGVRVVARARVTDLLDEPAPPPSYPPIISECAPVAS